MGFMDKILSRKGDIDLDHDPFANQEQGGLPSESIGPYKQPNQDPFAQNQQGMQPGSQPPAFDTSNPDMNTQLGIPKPDPYKHEQPSHQGTPINEPVGSTGGVHVEKDLQIIIAKLDALKSELDSLHQRVKKIEHIAEADQQAAKQHEQKKYQW